MGDLIWFVDSVSASATTRLDLNDETSGWAVRSFSAPPPRLRRTVASNAMRDGISVGSSSYDSRVLTIELECIKADQDAAASELQKLARELDRAGNYIRYQPNGLTKPVFFVTYRSDLSQIDDVLAQKAMRRFTIELLAEPFALGLRETLGPFTVNNDPAAASNGCYFDVTGVLGDVDAPPIIEINNSPYQMLLATRQHGTPSDLVWFAQAESLTLGADTTNPGGGPDAGMSGTGTNNYVRTTFATTTAMNPRVTWDVPDWTTSAAVGRALRGRYRMYARVRRNGNTSTLEVEAYMTSGGIGTKAIVPSTAAASGPAIVDLGTVAFGEDTAAAAAYEIPLGAPVDLDGLLQFRASRTGGTDTLDWDYVALVPADESTLIVGRADDSAFDLWIDSENEVVQTHAGTSPFAGGSLRTSPRDAPVATGGFPYLRPGQTNRMFLFWWTLNGAAIENPIAASNVVRVNYYPRYLYVRPVAS